MKTIKLGMIASMIVLTSACGKTPEGTVSTPLTFTGSGQPSTVVKNDSIHKLMDIIIPKAQAYQPTSLTDANGSTVVLSSAWTVIKEVEFESTEVAGADEVDGAEVELKGPYYVDLLSSSPTPLGIANVPTQEIRRIKMKLESQGTPPANAPSGLNGNSIYISGTVGGVPFIYSTQDGTEIHIGGPTPVIPDSSSGLVAVIRLSKLLSNIDMSSITTATTISESNRVTGTNLCPNIDTSANDLFTCFRKGFEKEANMGKDLDGNGDLEDTDESVK